MPWPLLCALDTSVLSADVEPESNEIVEEEFGVAKAGHATCQNRVYALPTPNMKVKVGRAVLFGRRLSAAAAIPVILSSRGQPSLTRPHDREAGTPPAVRARLGRQNM